MLCVLTVFPKNSDVGLVVVCSVIDTNGYLRSINEAIVIFCEHYNLYMYNSFFFGFVAYANPSIFKSLPCNIRSLCFTRFVFDRNFSVIVRFGCCIYSAGFEEKPQKILLFK